jgi:type IV pilus assembly protein PilN
MRISINLASHPFVELRPLFARLRIAMVALVLLAVGLSIGLRLLSRRVSAAESRMQELQKQTTTLVNERNANETRMRQPQNQAILERSRFLNDVFRRKSFSWTAVMMDLENVLPAGVQVTSIEPGITPEGDVNIRLRVSGDRDREVELVRNLERSQRFISPRIVNESAKSQDQSRPTAAGLAPGAVEFDILSGYNPLPAQKAALQKEKSASTGVKPPVSKPASVASPSASSARPPTTAGGAR